MAGNVLEYQVYNGVTNLGGVPVSDRNGSRTVRMTNAQAQYWIDQGVIGLQKERETSAAAQAARRQFRGTRET